MSPEVSTITFLVGTIIFLVGTFALIIQFFDRNREKITLLKGNAHNTTGIIASEMGTFTFTI